MDENLPNHNQLQKWISPISILFLLYGIFFLPFWEPLLLAFFFACALAPLTHYLHAKFHSNERRTSYLLLALLITLLLSIFAISGIRIFSLIYEHFQNLDSLNSNFSAYDSVKNQIIQWLKQVPFLNDQNLERQVEKALTGIGAQAQEFMINATKVFVIRTPVILLNIFIFLLSLAVLMAWGPKKWKLISKLPGLGSRTDQSHYQHFERVCAISIGSIFLTGLLQSCLVAIGAAITGYPAPICFITAFILSLIPVLGAASVPVFLALVSYANNSPGSAVILLITALIAGTSDNILRAWLFSKASNTNPVVSLLALLGGISLFGLTGLFLAPIVEQLVMSYLQNENKQKSSLKTPQKWRGFTFKKPAPSL